MCIRVYFENYVHIDVRCALYILFNIQAALSLKQITRQGLSWTLVTEDKGHVLEGNPKDRKSTKF